MEENKSIEENLDSFQKLVDDLASLNINISDEDQAIQLLTSLPPLYEALVHTLKYGSGKDTLSVSDVTTSAYSKEVVLKEKGLLNRTRGNSEGLYVESRGRSERRPEKGNYKPRSKSRGRSKSRPKYNKNTTGCFLCGKEGHWKRECPDRHGKKPSSSANVATKVTEKVKEPLVLTASKHDSKGAWVMDSGCSFHITPDKESLFDLQELDGGKVLMGNMTHSEVKGIGKIKILNPDNFVVILTEVRYMPTMGRNLISYGQLEKSGCRYEGKDFVVTFYKDGQKVISGKYQDGLYYLQGRVVQGESMVARPETDMTKIWHSRLGHMSLKCMNILVKDGYLTDKEVKTLGFCESSVLGKSHKLSFTRSKHATKGVLEYIHSDLWGSPSVEKSLGNCQYFITFIDDFSKKVWIYFLKTKDEAFLKFKEWKAMVENQTGKKVRCLRTDNGLKFCNNMFDNFCKDSGIKRHRTCTYTPQQNGVSERMNRTIMDKVRCMLAESGLEEKFWAEAASTAVYLINRSPNSYINFKLPEEVWSGERPKISHLRRFGCSAYVHVSQGKTSPRAIKGLFLGYPQWTKGYRIWIEEEDKCVISRDIIFHEEELYKDTLKQKDEGDSRKIDETTQKKSKGKRVTFSENLIQGPSGTFEVGETSDQGGASSGTD